MVSGDGPYLRLAEILQCGQMGKAPGITSVQAQRCSCIELESCYTLWWQWGQSPVPISQEFTKRGKHRSGKDMHWGRGVIGGRVKVRHLEVYNLNPKAQVCWFSRAATVRYHQLRRLRITEICTIWRPQVQSQGVGRATLL